MDSNGNPHISYYDFLRYDLKYARWSGSAWGIQTVDSDGIVGSYTSLALDSSDKPHISYYDDGNAILKYATLTGVDQYEVTFSQTGVGSDFGGTVVTVDSVDYEVTDLPVTFTWNKDSSHTFSYASPLDTGLGKKYIWTGTSGFSTLQSDTLIITGPGSVTANYQTPNQLMEAMIKTIKTWNLPKGTENSFTSKLKNALQSFEIGQQKATINKLNAFINEVQAQTNKKLTTEQANMLISEAQRIIDNIGL